MSKFAEKTSVPAERSRSEIERVLSRYGADGFMYGWLEKQAVLAFTFKKRKVQFNLPLVDPKSRSVTHSHNGTRVRSKAGQQDAIDQENRRRWRALALVIKAKLEAVESGITVFEDEFMAHIVLPSGQRVGEWLQPQIDRAYETGKMPPLLPGGSHA